MIRAIQGSKNSVIVGNKKNNTPKFGSTVEVVYHPRVDRELSKLRISSNEAARFLLGKIARHIEIISSLARKDGRDDLVKIKLQRLDGIVGERESLRTLDPTLSGCTVRNTKDGEFLHYGYFGIVFKE